MQGLPGHTEQSREKGLGKRGDWEFDGLAVLQRSYQVMEETYKRTTIAALKQ